MVDNIPHIRVFISSPGDVTQERGIAAKVIDNLNFNDEFQGKFALQPMRWDDPQVMLPMSAIETAQLSVDRYLIKPSQCDLVIVLFWSKMGTPVTLDGREYLSGTHYEFSDALEAGVATWVYRRDDKPDIDLTKPDYKQKIEQWEAVQEFFAGFTAPDGQIKMSYNTYQQPDDFRQLFEGQLITHLRYLRDNPPEGRTLLTEKTPELEIWPGSPFPGLRAFTPAGEPIFFGRVRETGLLIKLIAESRFVAVIGASGSGKSSLVAAGLIPHLRDDAIPDSKGWILPEWVNKQWAGLRFTPGELGGNPFLALAAKLAPMIGGVVQDMAGAMEKDVVQLETLCTELLHDEPERAEVFIFIDQFEELFTIAEEKYRDPFVAMLAYPARRVRIMVTMRSDFYHRCIDVPQLARLLEDGQFPLPVAAETLLDMIVRPAQRAALTFDDGLTWRILDDTGHEPGALALMAYALDELYEIAKKRRDKEIQYIASETGNEPQRTAKMPSLQITFDDYYSLDGVQGAIGKRAQGVFQELDFEAQATLPRVFRDLVAVSAEGTPTRKRAALTQITPTEAEERLVKKLTKARLLVQNHGTDGANVEVAHEALFRKWPELVAWIDETKGDLYLFDQMRKAIVEWEANNRSRDYLWLAERGQDMMAMLARLQPELDDVEKAFARPEQEHLLDELKDIEVTHVRREAISQRLNDIDDNRSHIGLREDGLPDIAWCYVSPSGEIEIEIRDQTLKKPTFTVKPFYIAKYLITYPQFQAFLDASDGFKNDEWRQGLAEKMHDQGIVQQRQQYDNYPRDGVSWHQCVAFTRWLNHRYRQNGLFEQLPVVNVGTRPVSSLQQQVVSLNPDEYQIRLPTEWEWKWAAQNGDEKRKYPWGEWDGRLANTFEAGVGRPTAVGMYPQGIAECGALDMSGNLWEWCLNKSKNLADDSMGGEDERTLRGGSYDDQRDRAACSSPNRNSRISYTPGYRWLKHGLRVVCAASPL
jgi:formylglycine-generating enzyme required for sulfatase activity